MKTIQLDYKNFVPTESSISLCLGYFDGVHLGHAELLENAKKNAKFPLGILTFSEPIASFINNGKTSTVLTSLDDRFKIINRFGLDYYFVLHIDKDFVNYSVDQFITFLKKLNVIEIFVGEDYRFASKQAGGISDLEKCFEVHVCPIKMIDDTKVSTSKIKELLLDGKLEKANHLLGHNYLMTGSVIHGRGLGNQIGFPTLNLKLQANYVLPKFGVYKTICYLDNVPHTSITNVGNNPTIGNTEPRVEIHLKDYKKDTYGDVVRVEFLEFIREEITFSSLDELKKQINEDIKKVF